MDIAMIREDNAAIADVLTGFVKREVHFHPRQQKTMPATCLSISSFFDHVDNTSRQ